LSDPDDEVKSVIEVFKPAPIKKRLNALHDRLVWLQQREREICDDASLLMRNSRDPQLTDEFCDLIFDSDRRKLSLANAMSEVAKLIRKESDWAKIFK
jgi:hypothetical protein